MSGKTETCMFDDSTCVGVVVMGWVGLGPFRLSHER